MCTSLVSATSYLTGLTETNLSSSNSKEAALTDVDLDDDSLSGTERYVDGCTLLSGEIMTYHIGGFARIHVQISTSSSCCVRIVIEEYEYITVQTAHYRYYSSVVWKRLGHADP